MQNTKSSRNDKNEHGHEHSHEHNLPTIDQMYKHLRDNYMPNLPDNLPALITLNSFPVDLNIDTQSTFNSAVSLLRSVTSLTFDLLSEIHPMFCSDHDTCSDIALKRRILSNHPEVMERLGKTYDLTRSVSYLASSVLEGANSIPERRRILTMAKMADATYQVRESILKPAIAEYHSLLAVEFRKLNNEQIKKPLYS